MKILENSKQINKNVNSESYADIHFATTYKQSYSGKNALEENSIKSNLSGSSNGL